MSTPATAPATVPAPASAPPRAPPPSPRAPDRRRRLGLALCVAAVLAAGGGWLFTGGDITTDNAYVRGDVTALAPKVAGYVVAVDVNDNQSVRAGDVLFRIDDRDHRARLAQADANVDAARARLANAEAELGLHQAVIRQADAQRQASVADRDLAAKSAARRRELLRTQVVSQSQVDESDAAHVRADAGVAAAAATLDAQRRRTNVLQAQRDAAAAALAQAEAARALAQIDVDNTIVRAPLAGVVGNRQVRVGRLVTPGVAVLDLVPADDVWIVANFKETQLESLRAGQPVRISVDGFPGETFAGVVDSFAPGSGASFSLLPADNATGNFVRVVQRVPVKIRFVDAPLPARLVPGLSARVAIDPGHGP